MPSIRSSTTRGLLSGYNTDAEGARRALSERANPAGKKILIVGAGGAARAVAFGLAGVADQLHIANRTQAKAQALAKRLQTTTKTAVTSSDLNVNLGDYDVVVNASSAGMTEYGGAPPGSPN